MGEEASLGKDVSSKGGWWLTIGNGLVEGDTIVRTRRVFLPFTLYLFIDQKIDVLTVFLVRSLTVFWVRFRSQPPFPVNFASPTVFRYYNLVRSLLLIVRQQKKVEPPFE